MCSLGACSGRRRYHPPVRVLVTGATGFVGSHVVTALHAAGHDVRCLVRDPSRLDAAPPDVGPDAVEVAVGDVLDRGSLERALDGCDGVVHAAGAVGVARARPGSRDVNVEGTRNVVGLGFEAGCDPVVYTSSVVVLDGTARVLTADSPLGSPTGPYGRSKLLAEQHVRRMQDGGAPVVTFYIGGVFGPDAPEVSSGMLGIVGAVNQLMPITGGGVGIIDVRDVADLVAAALEPGRGPRRFMAGGRFVDWGAWTVLLEQVTGGRIRRLRVPGPVLREAGRVLDLLKAVHDFDYPLTREAAMQMTSSPRCDDSATFAALGIEPRPILDTLRDSTRWLVEVGRIDAHRAPELS